MKFAARLFNIFFFFAILFFIFKPSVFAQNPPANTNPDVPNNLHNYTQNIMIEVMSSLSCQLAGVDPTNPNGKCLGIDPNTQKIGFVQNGGGAIAVVGSFIAATFTPPLHTGDYFSYLAGNFGISKNAYAAENGLGFEGLSPLVKAWEAFRNITYLLFVIVFVVIGFAIMLRIHIDPRTVMTVENQIPKIIIGLILVTFSFAIAGFLIDLMYVGISLVVGIFAQIDPKINADIARVTNPIQAANTMGGLGDISQSAAGAAGNFFASVLNNNMGRLLTGAGLALMGALGGNAMIDLIGGLTTLGPLVALKPIMLGLKASGLASSAVAGSLAILGITFAPLAAGVIGTIITFMVIIIAMLSALFRLWFALIMAYVMILIDVIFAPFWIVLGLIPGSSIGFSAWLRDLGSNLLAFPAAIVMFMLGRTLIDAFADAPGKLFVPPLIGNPAGGLIGNFIGLGIILMTPTAVDIMKGFLKAPKFDLKAVTQAIGVGTAFNVNTGKQIGGLIAHKGDDIQANVAGGWKKRGLDIKGMIFKG